MEKIKAALHIHDKTPVPNDGAVGNMQNPSSSEQNEPTATELWGAGNKDSIHHHDRKADTVAAAAPKASSTARGTGSTTGDDPSVILENSVVQGKDDPYSHAQQAQYQAPSGNDALGEKVLTQDISQRSAAEEKTGSSSPAQWSQLEPLNQPEPSAETGPATHFRPDTTTTAASTETGQATRFRPDTTTTAASTGGGEIDSKQGGHTTYYDMATGREPHTTQGKGVGN